MKGGRRYCQALDLADDAQLIAEYRQHHRRIWPEITQHLRQYGIVDMEIYLLGNRLVMMMETAAGFDSERFALASERDPKVCEWEALMWKYQRPTPWTPPGEKWRAMEKIFCLREQDRSDY
ncbi:L-rhamnose mutarotase [Pantoea sp. FN060301]|uniref:L-rhamnose mutarotase n=1 Tax=Pantoea sp. FN060301 TaxID=3420380 RepID=UPI003D165917